MLWTLPSYNIHPHLHLLQTLPCDAILHQTTFAPPHPHPPLLQVELCKVKLDRAVKLIAGLGGEKSRWTAAAAALGDSYSQLAGDVLLAAAQIAYLGPFTSTYRADCVASWVEAARAAAVPCGEKFRLSAVLGDAVKIRCGHDCAKAALLSS